jgi:antagonist of KipI
MNRAAFEVIDGGLATTVQDRGRPDCAHLGVPPSGACDPWSLAVANLLVGNDRAAAAIEMTLIGPTLIARRSTVVGLAGADLGGRASQRAGIEGSRRLAPGRSHRIEEGEMVAFPGDGSDRRARAYLAVPGGIDVPEVLGSRSTCLAAGFGGVEGRPLQAGDVVAAALHRSDDAGVGERVWPDDPLREPTSGDVVLRILPGPASGLQELVATRWSVGREADRVGLRLDGPSLPDGIAGEVISHGVTWGAIQVPPDGRPIVLVADHQTTGGYPAVAIVISADRPVIGQLRPGTEVGFRAVNQIEALAALREQEAALHAGARALDEAARWDELARSAGG